MTTTFIAYASAQGVKIDELRTELEGDIDVRAFEELIKLAERRLPVSNSVRNGVPIEFSLAE